MRRRLFQLILSSSLLLVFFSSNLLPLFSISAHAALPNDTTTKTTGVQYTLYFPDDNTTKGKLNQAAKDGGIGDTDLQGPLGQTKILSKDGPLGTVSLSLDAQKSNQNDLPTYSLDYYCSPLDSYNISTSQPDENKPYVRYTLGITLLKSNNWKGMVSSPDYETHYGLLGDGSVGTIHFPSTDMNGKGFVDAKDFDASPRGPTKNSLSNNIDATSTGYVGKDGSDYQFNNPYYGSSDPAYSNFHDVLVNCGPSKVGLTDGSVTNYSQLSAAGKTSWNDATGGNAASFASSGAGGSSSSSDTTPTCDSSGISLSWILCPVFNLISDGAHWLFQSVVQPFLVTTPISLDAGDPSYQIWSNFRLYGDIFLIIGLLVIVFGQSIGGGMIDAYTAKKVLPRLLAAAILINLSIYIVAFLVDFTNILGKGVSDIMTAPLTNCTTGRGNCWDFALSNTDIVSVFGVGLVGFMATSTAVVGFLGGLFFGGAAFAGAAITAAFFVMLPVLIAIIGVFLTLVFRKGLILLLVLISPVAFALYCLPNTEKYFRKWWELLVEALMVYPIVILIFGAADILSITILQANSIAPSDLTGHMTHDFGRTLALVVAFMLQFLPLLLIPFAFRFASGTLNRIYAAVTTGGQKIQSATERRREQAKMDYRGQHLSGRARTYQAWSKEGAKDTSRLGLKRRPMRFMAKRAGGYNIEALMSENQAQKGKQISDIYSTGRDEEVRGLSVDKAAALRGMGAKQDGVDDRGNRIWRQYNAATGQMGSLLTDDELNNYEYRIGDDGVRSFQSMGGAWVEEQHVDSAHSRWGRDQAAQQASLAYEMRKGILDHQRKRIDDKYMDVATSKTGWGMTDGNANGAWTGAAFENQNTNLSNKYKSRSKQDDGKYRVDFDKRGYIGEIYEKRSSQAMSQMSADDLQELTNAANAGDLSRDDQVKLKAIKDTMEYRLSAAGTGAQQEQAPGDDAGTQAMSYGPGHVTQKMQQFIDVVNTKGW
jgi:hypothetical protein